MWTLTPEDDIINVRAIISVVHQQDQLQNLIAALEKRLTKEPPHAGSADVRIPRAPTGTGTPGAAEKAEAEADPQTQGS
jgi:hypothetical protein